jgi:hypothetical protein
MCERLGFHPPKFAMSQDSFLRLEESFGLPRAALPLICRDTGMEYYRLGFGGQENDRQSLPFVCKSRYLDVENPVYQTKTDLQKPS